MNLRRRSPSRCVRGRVAAAAAPAGAAPPGRPGSSFPRPRPGPNPEQLFPIHPAGDGLQQLTTCGYPSIAPAFSPDGKRIAFPRPGVGILTMNVDGTGLRRLTTNGRDSFPAWSPDGPHIAFIRPPVQDRVEGQHRCPRQVPRNRRLVQAPPSGRPSWTPAGLLIPSGGDLLRLDPTKGHVQKYYNAEIDAIWGLNKVVTLSPSRLPDHVRRSASRGAGRQGVRRGPLPAVRALSREPDHQEEDTEADRQGRRTGGLRARRQADRLRRRRQALHPVGRHGRGDADLDRQPLRRRSPRRPRGADLSRS